MTEALALWIDGIATTTVPADDRGLHYGDGLFETVLVRNGTPRFLAAHRARLQRGLQKLEIQFQESRELESEIARAAALAPPLAILKVIITRGSAVRRGYLPSRKEHARRIVSLWPTAPLESDLVDNGVVLDVCQLRLPEYSPFAGIKHLNRLENVLAAMHGGGGVAFDGLMLDIAGRVVSCTSSNVFLVKSGGIVTPPVDRMGVAGVMREIVLREAPSLGIAVREQPVTLADVQAADGIFITNARIGVVPVKRVREHVFGMSDITNRLRQALGALDA